MGVGRLAVRVGVFFDFLYEAVCVIHGGELLFEVFEVFEVFEMFAMFVVVVKMWADKECAGLPMMQAAGGVSRMETIQVEGSKYNTQQRQRGGNWIYKYYIKMMDTNR